MPESTVELLKRLVEAQKKLIDKPQPLRREEDEIVPPVQPARR